MSVGLSKIALMIATYFFPFAGWGVILYIVMHLVKLLKKRKRADLKTRMWKEFRLANREIYPLLNQNEKEEMAKVIQTTIMNAQLFRNKSSDHTDKSQCTRKVQKTITKKVCFQLPSQRSK